MRGLMNSMVVSALKGDNLHLCISYTGWYRKQKKSLIPRFYFIQVLKQHVLKLNLWFHSFFFSQKPCISCAFNSDGSVLAVGTTVGRFVVLNTEDGMHVTSVQVGREQLGVMKYSPGKLVSPR